MWAGHHMGWPSYGLTTIWTGHHVDWLPSPDRERPRPVGVSVLEQDRRRPEPWRIVSDGVEPAVQRPQTSGRKPPPAAQQNQDQQRECRACIRKWAAAGS